MRKEVRRRGGGETCLGGGIAIFGHPPSA